MQAILARYQQNSQRQSDYHRKKGGQHRYVKRLPDGHRKFRL